ncbi:MAG: hypothetical protein ABEN55_22845 [Bradymonadaceae bacterium]
MTPEQMNPEQLKKFLVYYRRRIERDPENVEARLRLATVFREMGQRRRAIEQYEAAAQLLDDQGLALEAIAACKAILELDPSRVEAQYFLARLYAQTPDATDQSARVAQPVEVADESNPHELVREADDSAVETDELPADERDRALQDEELFETQEWEAESDEAAPEETAESENEKSTRVADYDGMSADDWSGDTDEDLAERKAGEPERIELTPEEQERREGFSREEMQELLTTIDVDPEDIVDVEDVAEYEFEDQLVEEMDEDVGTDEPDFELGEDLEVDETADDETDEL